MKRSEMVGWLVVVSLVVGGLFSLTSCNGDGGGGPTGGTGSVPSGGIKLTATVTSPAGTRTFNANAVKLGLCEGENLSSIALNLKLMFEKSFG